MSYFKIICFNFLRCCPGCFANLFILLPISFYSQFLPKNNKHCTVRQLFTSSNCSTNVPLFFHYLEFKIFWLIYI